MHGPFPLGQVDVPKDELQPSCGLPSTVQQRSLATLPPPPHSTLGGHQGTAQDVPTRSTGTGGEESLEILSLVTCLRLALPPGRPRLFVMALNVTSKLQQKARGGLGMSEAAIDHVHM